MTLARIDGGAQPSGAVFSEAERVGVS